MKINVLTFFLFLSLTSFAQSGNIIGEIRHGVSNLGISSVLVTLTTEEGNLIDSCRSKPGVREMRGDNWIFWIPDPKRGASFSLKAPHEGRYILSFEKEGLETVMKEVEARFTIRHANFNAGSIIMFDAARQLSEAVVTGTRIKMFYRGDTLVYNAAAFQTSDGSMLEDLIKMLPGAEFKDGNIYVNGQKMEELLINGHDFFQGDPELALKNLPAYTVDKIKVFSKDGPQSRLAGRDMGDRHIVMDVRLKRDYNAQWTGQIDGSYGTDKRYSGGLFGMYFDDRQSFMLSVQSNNLNKDYYYSRWGQAGTYSNIGQHDLKKIDLNYSFEPTDVLRFSLGANYRHGDDETDDFTSTQLFLSKSDSYSRQRKLTHSRVNQFQAKSDLEWRPCDNFFMQLKYHFNLNANENHHQDSLANYASEPNEDFLRSAWSSWNNVTNRQTNETFSETSFLQHHADFRADFSLRPDILTLTASLNYTNGHNQSCEQYRLESPSSTLQRQTLTPSANHAIDMDYHAEYIYKYATLDQLDGYLKPYYTFNNKISYERNPFYLHETNEEDLLSDNVWQTFTDEHLDPFNSYTINRRISRHDFGLQLRHLQNFKSNQWIELRAEAAFTSRYVSATQWQTDIYYKPTRNGFFAVPKFFAHWYVKNSEGRTIRRLRFSYELQRELPDPMLLISIPKERTPLFVSLGNPSLQSPLTHKMILGWLTDGKKWSQYGSLSYSLHHNAIGTLRHFDHITGILSTQAVNIRSGQWNAELSQRLSGPLPFGAYFVVNGTFSYAHTADLNQTASHTDSQRHGVDLLNFAMHATIAYNPTHQLDTRLSLDWNTNFTNGSRPDFNDICTHLLSLTYVLYWNKAPLGFYVQTSINLRKPYGWGSREMNSARCNWNFRLGRSFLNKRLSVAMEIHDLLNQSMERTLTLSEYARTERTSLSLGRYILFNLNYRWNILPKKKRNRA